MAKLSTSPEETFTLRLEQRKSFSFAVLFSDRNDAPVDITGSTLTLDVLTNRAKRLTDVLVPTDVLTVAAGLYGPTEGYARFDVQAAQLDLPAAEYPYTITLLTAEGYSLVVAKGVIQLQANPESAATAATYADGGSVATIDVKLRGMNVLAVTIGPRIPPKKNWLSDTDQAKLDLLSFVSGGVEVDVSALATSEFVVAGDSATLAAAGTYADAAAADAVVAAAAYTNAAASGAVTSAGAYTDAELAAASAASADYADAGDAATLAAADAAADAGDAATLAAAKSYTDAEFVERLPVTALLSVVASFAAYDGGFEAPRYTKDSNGIVTLQGLIRRTGATGTFAPGGPLVVLPVGARPSGTLVFTVVKDSVLIRADVWSNGGVYFPIAATWTQNTTFVSLSGISFKAA